MNYELIFSTLATHNVRYLVAGGMAVILHGVMRFTADLDLFVDMSKENVLALCRAMSDMGYTPRVPVTPEDFADPNKRRQWIEEKHMKVFTFIDVNNPVVVIDIFVFEPIPFADAWNNRTMIAYKGIDLHVVDKEDLIRLKTLAGRPQDIEDIKALRMIKDI